MRSFNFSLPGIDLIENSTIEKCKQGLEEGHGQLYNGSIKYVYHVVKRYLDSDEDVKDTVQEIYARTFQSINSFDPRKGDFKSWLRKITVNECISFYKKKSKKSFLTPLSETPEIAVSDSKIEDLSKEDILKMLSSMPEGYKVVFMLHAIDGFKHVEIAEQLNIKAETSRSQYQRAKNWILKNIISKENTSAYGLF